MVDVISPIYPPATAKVRIDTIEDLEMNEKWGVVVGVSRKMRVLGLSGTDYKTLYQALNIAGVPQQNAYLDGYNTQLILIDRNVKMIDKDKADVFLNYGPFNDKGQVLFYDGGIASRAIAGKMSTTIVQKDTNIYRANGVGETLPIILEHTYPATDADYAGKTVQQTGTVSVAIPQRTFVIEGIKSVLAPWDMAERLHRSTNRLVWLGQDPGTWMCTEVTWEYRTEGNYFMTFTFQHEEDGWDPSVVFIDDRTSRPPAGVSVDDGSVLTVPYFRRSDFVQELGFFVVGPAQQ